jgi:hypothetical protein
MLTSNEFEVAETINAADFARFSQYHPQAPMNPQNSFSNHALVRLQLGRDFDDGYVAHNIQRPRQALQKMGGQLVLEGFGEGFFLLRFFGEGLGCQCEARALAFLVPPIFGRWGPQ